MEGYHAERILSRSRHAATTARVNFSLHLLDERRQVSEGLAQRPGLTKRRRDVAGDLAWRLRGGLGIGQHRNPRQRVNFESVLNVPTPIYSAVCPVEYER